MKPISKFSNLGPSGIARRIVPAEPRPKRRPPDRPDPVMVTPEKPKRGSGGAVAAVPKSKDRVTAWREKNPDLYKERQRAYAKKHRAKKKAVAGADK